MLLGLNIRNRRFADKKRAKQRRAKKQKTISPGVGPPLPRAPGKKIRRSGDEAPHSDEILMISRRKFLRNVIGFSYEIS